MIWYFFMVPSQLNSRKRGLLIQGWHYQLSIIITIPDIYIYNYMDEREIYYTNVNYQLSTTNADMLICSNHRGMATGVKHDKATGWRRKGVLKELGENLEISRVYRVNGIGFRWYI